MKQGYTKTRKYLISSFSHHAYPSLEFVMLFGDRFWLLKIIDGKLRKYQIFFYLNEFNFIQLQVELTEQKTKHLARKLEFTRFTHVLSILLKIHRVRKYACACFICICMCPLFHCNISFSSLVHLAGCLKYL